MSLLQIYWRALGYLAADRKRVAFICGANIALAIIAILEPIMFGRVIDAISDGGSVFSTLGVWAGIGVFNVVAFVLVARGADRFAHARRSEVLCQSFERVITMPLAWHHQRGTSNSLHTLLRAVETLFSLWLEFMRQHLSTVVALVLLVPTAISMDIRMSMVLLALGALYVGIGRLVMRRTKEGQASVERHFHKVFAHVSDSVSNVAVLQSYNRIGHETDALKRYVKNLLDAQYPVLDWWALANALHRLSSTISMMVVLLIGSYLVMHGQLRIGDVIAFTGFATLLIARLDQMSAFANQISEARAKLEEFYRLEDSAADAAEPDGLRDLGNVTGHVRFENVSFEFANSGQGVNDVSFEVRAGQTVAIVGPTGAGKTTLINLLQRVFAPSSGRILIDGIDTRTVTRKSLRHSIATVFQDAGLLNRSIEDNIRVGRAEATYDEVHAAANAAAAQDFILSKSNGYDTVVGERGGQLSGGERQRIAIARAVLKDSPILVLDEATSALDVETEDRVKEAIDELRRGRTTFIIAHRLTTVRDADLVVFMDKGKVVEMGGFAELSMRNGRFASLLRAGGLLNDEEVRRLSRTITDEAA
ncbi:MULTISPECIES: glucan ABC transporter ATP-binding protein/ permease [unclassified Mesorhizobium]|uniref:glucan ABC transporter ATP-binding protein/ permease n=1 Tax=unclassified Mesorhizobium TaxID=325217 RepID=UPI000FD3E45E|nr:MULTISPECIES: glucan ABC transporter ATP-binding protein/ permease [unclassified Mesorhizobium]RVB73589.1 glucan ABC transporter ATP-binding protein/ permease [Mesorhizobium sp. M6A.T.Cr.TU.014.01.1.1]RWP72587.1 MAG: glucan ABC transporter ATP-binding protein/ permease [Mesorhizobium sp.]RWP98426.1 MAG: glucan ABC transporter ATP-binding protein/ permease [Mesorhizobium sp.]RWQ00621.1 MAG: glucan ABC transporter ATP-binding protein/ permease [Mesorhizobium sp.]TIT02651.1 MAG: glucan ABC tra